MRRVNGSSVKDSTLKNYSQIPALMVKNDRSARSARTASRSINRDASIDKLGK